jgi:hypothetical protein
VLASVTSLLLLPSDYGLAEQLTKTDAGTAAAAGQIAEIFSAVGDEIYENCIFELSQEQIDVQHALVQAYMQQGASGSAARRLAATQIQRPKLSEKCEQIRRSPEVLPSSWGMTLSVPKRPTIATAPKPPPEQPAPAIALTAKKGLPQWDCAPGVDYVTIHLNGYERKLTGGEICNPYEDVVRECPHPCELPPRCTISTGRLFVIADDPQVNGRTIAWGSPARTSAKQPRPGLPCHKSRWSLAAREYSFAAEKDRRVNWGPRTKRSVVGVYLKNYGTGTGLALGKPLPSGARNIAIHVREGRNV